MPTGLPSLECRWTGVPVHKFSNFIASRHTCPIVLSTIVDQAMLMPPLGTLQLTYVSFAISEIFVPSFTSLTFLFFVYTYSNYVGHPSAFHGTLNVQ